MARFCLSYSNDELILYQSAWGGAAASRIALPAGLVQAGRVTSPETFAQIVTQAMAQARPHVIRGSRIIVGLPEDQAFIKLLLLPSKLSPSELRSAIDYQWENVLPISPDQVYYDCCYIDIPKGNQGKSKSLNSPVLVVAYPRDIVTALLTVLHQISLRPDLFLPASFGLARLLSSREPVILLDSTSGQDVCAFIVKDRLTLFSTILRTGVDDPKLVKQVDNLREFYLRATGGITGELKQIIILTPHYAGNLGQTLHSDNYTVALANVAAKSGDDTSMHQLSLVGLNRNRFRLSILPPELVLERGVRQQLTMLRALFVVIVSTVAIFTYFSLIFLVSLRSNTLSKVAYSNDFSARLTKESQSVIAEVSPINSLINRLAPLETKRSHVSDVTAAIFRETEAQSITPLKIAHQDAKTLVVEAWGANQDSINQFIANLKKEPVIVEIKQELSTTPTEAYIGFKLTIGLKVSS